MTKAPSDFLLTKQKGEIQDSLWLSLLPRICGILAYAGVEKVQMIFYSCSE